MDAIPLPPGTTVIQVEDALEWALLPPADWDLVDAGMADRHRAVLAALLIQARQ